jgi:Fur family transcriptional regulator, ferric uptake regulator
MIRNDEINQILTSKGLKPSVARNLILGICIESDLPLDVDSVAQKMGTKAHLATIYRTLEKFVSVRILDRIDFQEGKFRYEYMHGHHHHAVCNSCGKVEDVVDSLTEVEAIESRIRKESGFKVTKHALELFGICNKCQRSNHYA